jgi:hypothetical protein
LIVELLLGDNEDDKDDYAIGCKQSKKLENEEFTYENTIRSPELTGAHC